MSEYLKKRGFTEEVLIKWGLKDKPEKNIVIIPYYDSEDQLLYERKRYYGNDNTIPKYMSPSREEMLGGHSWLYGLWNLQENLKKVVITEGEFNAISVSLTGYDVLAVAGQSFSLTEKKLDTIPKSVEEIILIYDEYDFALKRASEIRYYFGINVKVKVAKYPDKRDANDYLVEGKLEELKNIIESAEVYFTDFEKAIIEAESENHQPITIDFSVLALDGDFITNYSKYASKLTDAPKIYHEIIGLVLLSTIIEDRVTFRGIKTNIYGVIVGKSTLMRKSASINIAVKILYKIDPKLLIPSDFSPEAFGERLSSNPKGLIYWSEFGQFLSISTRSYMVGIKEIITDLFDCPEERKRILKNREISIKDPYICIMTATIKVWLKVDRNDLISGFLGRFMFINAEPGEKDTNYIIPPNPNTVD